MNNKGFTLIEVISIIGLLGLCIVILSPNLTSYGALGKESELNTKLKIAGDAARMWAVENQACFKDDGCEMLSDCTSSDGTYTCHITLENLAKNALIAYDEETNIINPVTNDNINNEYIILKYDSNVGVITYEGNSLE